MKKNTIKIIFTFCIICCSMLYHVHGQNRPVPRLEGLNEYQVMIEVLEDQGIDIRALLRDESALTNMQASTISPDSILKYYNLKYDVDVSDDIIVDKGMVAVMAKSYTDSIVVRWGPTNVLSWEKLMRTGYVLERWTMTPAKEEEMQWIDESSSLLLADSNNPILPYSLQQMSEVITPADTMALIAAQAIYGSSFGPTVNTDSLDFLSRQKEKEMRFGISLLMADRSTLAAHISGLRYVDKNVEAGKSYTYIIRPIGIDGIDNYAMVTNDIAQNDVVVGLNVQASDGTLKLYWPKSPNAFSGYWVERSSDGGNSWQKLTSDPIVFIELEHSEINPPEVLDSIGNSLDKEISANEYYIFVDSVVNYTPYTYRISGQTPFADYTDYAFIEGMAQDLTAPPTPLVVFQEVNEQTSIATVKWEMNYSPDALEDVEGFTVWEAPHPNGPFVQISELLPPSTRIYSSTQPLEKNRSHYYLLKTQDVNGNESSGFPLYMHVIDDVPPAPPLDPIYEINDTLGVVTLRWKPNKELDIQGYRVYFANGLTREFSQLTKAPIYQNVYYDTIALVTLNEIIYYKMQAVDLSHNRSLFSEIVEVKRPDFVAPVAPVMEAPEITSDDVKLTWRRSNSIDVMKQILYRRLYANDEEWQVLQEIEDITINTFSDTNGRVEQLYEYTIQVVDDAGLNSDYAFPVKGRRWFENIIPVVDDFSANYDPQSKAVTLNWFYQPINHELLEGVDYKFYIYRSVGETPLVTYRILASGQTSFLDQKTTEDGDYNYAIKVVYMNGKSGAMSTQQKISIKD